MFYVYHIDVQPGGDLTRGYVGVTRYPESRFAQHARAQRSIVGRAIRKHGLTFEQNLLVLHEFPLLDEALKKEEELRPREYMGWNINVGGLRSGSTSASYTPEVRDRIRRAKVGALNPRFGKPVGPELREKLSLAHLGERNHFFGRKHSEESRSKISTTLLAKPAEWRSENAAKAGRSNTGKEKSDSQKANMAEAARRRPRLRCPHCGKEGQVQGMKRYHMDNCKEAR